MNRIFVFVVLVLFCSTTFAENDITNLWNKFLKPEIKKPVAKHPEPVVKGEWPIYLAQFPTRIPVPARNREFVNPETVGVEKDCPLPTVKDPVCFECPKCGLKSKTNVLYHYLPDCPKDRWIMNEIEKW